MDYPDPQIPTQNGLLYPKMIHQLLLGSSFGFRLTLLVGAGENRQETYLSPSERGTQIGLKGNRSLVLLWEVGMS